jgi:serine/threonine protein kinase
MSIITRLKGSNSSYPPQPLLRASFTLTEADVHELGLGTAEPECDDDAIKIFKDSGSFFVDSEKGFSKMSLLSNSQGSFDSPWSLPTLPKHNPSHAAYATAAAAQQAKKPIVSVYDEPVPFTRPPNSLSSANSMRFPNFVSYRRVPDIGELYEIEYELGSGGFAVVYRGIEISSRKEYALKMMPIFSVKSHQDFVENEVRILGGLNHPRLVGLHEVVRTERYLVLVMELVRGGELFDQIIQMKKFSEVIAKDIFVQILEAIAELHAHGIIHRDLKPENILLEGDGIEGCEVKVTDFGLSVFHDDKAWNHKGAGTPEYSAPEVVNGQPHDYSCDMWSVGVILYIMLSGTPPFRGINEGDLMKAVSKGAYTFPAKHFASVSAEAKDLIFKLLVVDPRNRLTVQQVRDHPWLLSTCKEDDVPLPNTARNLSTFNAMRKLRKGVFAVIAMNKLSNVRQLIHPHIQPLISKKSASRLYPVPPHDPVDLSAPVAATAATAPASVGGAFRKSRLVEPGKRVSFHETAFFVGTKSMKDALQDVAESLVQAKPEPVKESDDLNNTNWSPTNAESKKTIDPPAISIPQSKLSASPPMPTKPSAPPSLPEKVDVLPPTPSKLNASPPLPNKLVTLSSMSNKADASPPIPNKFSPSPPRSNVRSGSPAMSSRSNDNIKPTMPAPVPTSSRSPIRTRMTSIQSPSRGRTPSVDGSPSSVPRPLVPHVTTNSPTAKRMNLGATQNPPPSIASGSPALSKSQLSRKVPSPSVSNRDLVPSPNRSARK